MKNYSEMRLLYNFSSQSYTPRVFLTSYSTLSNFPFHQTLSKIVPNVSVEIVFE